MASPAARITKPEIQRSRIEEISQRPNLFSRFGACLRRWYSVYLEEKFFYRGADQHFFQLMGGHIYFQSLAAAVEFDLFNLLEQSSGLPEKRIAELLGIELQPCQILLLALTNCRLLKRRRSGVYTNSRTARLYLTKSAKWKYLSCVRWQNHINYRPMAHFYEALRLNRNVGICEINGDEPTLYQRLVHNPQLEQIFQAAMQEISAQSNDLLGRFIDFSQTRSLVDVGGGNATNIIRIAKGYPHLKASVFDSASVCKLALENITSHGLESRLTAVSGNIFVDALPQGVDCVLFCHFFTIWSPEEHRILLRRAYEALPKGGRVIVFNMMQNDSRSGPASAAVGSPYFLTLATGRGMLYRWQDYERAFYDAGFAEVESIRLPRDHGALVGTKR